MKRDLQKTRRRSRRVKTRRVRSRKSRRVKSRRVKSRRVRSSVKIQSGGSNFFGKKKEGKKMKTEAPPLPLWVSETAAEAGPASSQEIHTLFGGAASQSFKNLFNHDFFNKDLQHFMDAHAEEPLVPRCCDIPGRPCSTQSPCDACLSLHRRMRNLKQALEKLKYEENSHGLVVKKIIHACAKGYFGEELRQLSQMDNTRDVISATIGDSEQVTSMRGDFGGGVYYVMKKLRDNIEIFRRSACAKNKVRPGRYVASFINTNALTRSARGLRNRWQRHCENLKLVIEEYITYFWDPTRNDRMRLEAIQKMLALALLGKARELGVPDSRPDLLPNPKPDSPPGPDLLARAGLNEHTLSDLAASFRVLEEVD